MMYSPAANMMCCAMMCFLWEHDVPLCGNVP